MIISDVHEKQYIYKPHIPYVDMGLKEFIQRLLARGYVSLDKKGAIRLLSNIDFFRGKGYTFLFSFFKQEDENDK